MNKDDDFRVIGHHGTTKESARAIVKDGNFGLSTNQYDWLGNGAYFLKKSHFAAP